MERRCWVNFQCRGVLLVWMIVGQGPIALAVGAGGGCLDIFSLIYLFSFLSPSLWETARYRLKYCLKGPLYQKKKKKPKSAYLKNVSNRTFSPEREQLCQYILKFMHKFGSNNSDKPTLNHFILCPWSVTLTFNLNKTNVQHGTSQPKGETYDIHGLQKFTPQNRKYLGVKMGLCTL